MDYNVEQLVGSLIKMVGKLNDKVDTLNSRVYQLEEQRPREFLLRPIKKV